MATPEQKNQFIAKLATCTDPRKWESQKFQLLVGLPADEFDSEFAALLNTWEPTMLQAETAIIALSSLPEATFPTWSRGRVLTGVVEPKTLDLSKLSTGAWFHPRQTGRETRPTGHEILAALVSAYDGKKVDAGKTYAVLPTDIIHGHYGLRTLTWLAQNWKTLPKAFREWAKGNLLYGWLDVVRLDDGCLNVPALNCLVEAPCVSWYRLGPQWSNVEPALREQVSSQG
jgi:hypothetical protein